MPGIFRKIAITFAILTFVLFIVLVITAWALGAFSNVELTRQDSGPYYFITFSEHTSYRAVPVSLDHLKELGVVNDDLNPRPAALILNDPMTTPLQELQAFGGYIIRDSVQTGAGQKLFRIEKRMVVTASIDANPTIATFKTYPALSEWLRKNYRSYSSELPYLEIYHADEGVSVEMPLIPIRPDSSETADSAL